MKKILVLILGGTSLISAQLSTVNGSYVCPLGAEAFCASDTLVSNIIIRCIGTAGIAGNCNDNLAGIPPVGVKTSALCYQSSPSTGNAACSFNGTVYPDNASPFPVSRGSSTALSTSSTGSGASQSSSMTTVTTTIIETGITKTVTTTVPCSTSTTIAVTTTTTFASQPSGFLPPYPSQPSNPQPPYPSSNATTTTVPIISVPGTGTGVSPPSASTTFTYPFLPSPSSSSTPEFMPSSLSSSHPPISTSALSSSLGTPTGTGSGATSTSTVAPSNGAVSFRKCLAPTKISIALLLIFSICGQL